MSRADKFTPENKKQELYSDFLNNFDQNPVTGFLARVTNEESVKQSIKNIILTSVGERFYDSNKGSKIKQSLFDIFDPSNIEIIKIQVKEAIEVYEPRAIIQDIRFNPDLDRNAYYMTIIYSVINIPDNVFNLTLNILRVR